MMKDMPRILSINVRLIEGGAARIAMNLHKAASKYGFKSIYAYGYGRGAKISKTEADTGEVLCLTDRNRAIMNYVMHNLIGIDLLSPNREKKETLLAKIIEADVVHLHCIHSYFISYRWLLTTLIRYHKKVIWTVHDNWLTTGRCAISSRCENWKYGCGSCDNRSYYPASILDFSRKEFKTKHKIIAKMTNCTFVAVSNEVAKQINTIYPKHNVKVITNGIDEEFENLAIQSTEPLITECNSKVRHILIVSADLSYSEKVNTELINRLILNTAFRITTVGKNSPFRGENVRNIGVVANRDILFKLYAESDLTVYTSVCDTFGLVIAESLCAGTPVLALDSAASREVLTMAGGRTVNEEELIRRINEGEILDLYKVKSKKELKQRALQVFGSRSMISEYYSLYKGLLSEK